MKNQTVLVLDFGGQYKELIASQIRKLGVYAMIRPGSLTAAEIRAIAPRGIVLTGGPKSVYKDGSPTTSREIFELGIPVLGICYGMQLMSCVLGGKVEPAKKGGEYGIAMASLTESTLFRNMPARMKTLMSHFDAVTAAPDGFSVTAATSRCPIAAIADDRRKLYGVQFHPEVKHSQHGTEIFRNFLFDVCELTGDYNTDDVIDSAISEIRARVGGNRVLLALSGGVDSSVCAALIAKALPNKLTCVFVDHGLMRKNEGDEIEAVFTKRDIDFVRINAQDRFLNALAGVSDPERKRKTIGETFIRVFEDAAKELGKIPFLAQGTIYPDVIESGDASAATIKSHHNVGGLPENIGFEGLIEPLRGLFKDEVRAIGRSLGLPDDLVDRQPFPGPGLAVRVLGEITEEKLSILRESDAIVREEIGRLKKKPDQYFAVLPGIRSVGVVGDERAHDYVIGVRAVYTTDFMTAEYAQLPHRVLAKISARISNEVSGAGRVVYDISGKPPATIEWE